MNPYTPTEINSTESQAVEEDPSPRKTPRLWPLMLLNLAFLLSAILVVVLPGLGSWLFVFDRRLDTRPVFASGINLNECRPLQRQKF